MGDIPFSEEKVSAIAERGFARLERYLAVLAGTGDRTFGFIYCSAGEFHIGTDVLLTTIHAIYVAKEVRSTLLGGRVSLGLFRAAERWSRAIGARDGVPFYDLDRRNDITAKRQYLFTEWDPTAKDDLDSLRSVFDSDGDGDGKLTAADADFAKFKVMVTNTDGSTTVTALAKRTPRGRWVHTHPTARSNIYAEAEMSNAWH